MSEEVLAKLAELKAGQDVLHGDVQALASDVQEIRAGQDAIRKESNEKFEMLLEALEGLSRHLGIRRAS